ncbi:hypothetical protein OG21DRAFT_837212 [Imleria badia]|nr:hypothetical protein OG21DRAFT_837212 [Imleria badia]
MAPEIVFKRRSILRRWWRTDWAALGRATVDGGDALKVVRRRHGQRCRVRVVVGDASCFTGRAPPTGKDTEAVKGVESEYEPELSPGSNQCTRTLCPSAHPRVPCATLCRTGCWYRAPLGRSINANVEVPPCPKGRGRTVDSDNDIRLPTRVHALPARPLHICSSAQDASPRPTASTRCWTYPTKTRVCASLNRGKGATGGR